MLWAGLPTRSRVRPQVSSAGPIDNSDICMSQGDLTVVAVGRSGDRPHNRVAERALDGRFRSFAAAGGVRPAVYRGSGETLPPYPCRRFSGGGDTKKEKKLGVRSMTRRKRRA